MLKFPLLYFIISCNLVNILYSQDDALEYKRMNIIIGGPEWVVKSIDDVSCIVEVEASSVMFSGNRQSIHNEFQPIFRIKKGLLLIERKITKIQHNADEIIPTISIRREKEIVTLLCKRHDDSIMEIPLKINDYQKLESIVLSALKVSKNMNAAHGHIVSDFKTAFDD